MSEAQGTMISRNVSLSIRRARTLAIRQQDVRSALYGPNILIGSRMRLR